MSTRPTSSSPRAPRRTPAAPRPRHRPGPVHFELRCDAWRSHRFEITLTVAAPAGPLQRVSLPVWIPGSYLVREFAKHLSGLRAEQGGKACAVTQLDKSHWDVACRSDQALVLHYEVYAYDNSVRTAWLDAARGFFNGTSVCLRVEGQEECPHTLSVAAPVGLKGWQLATGLTPLKVDRRGFGLYGAEHYDELVDCPVEMGAFWSGDFVSRGVPHRFVVAGAPPSFDGERLLADSREICNAAIDLWHARGERAPHRHYVFMLNAVNDGYGGLEQRNSTALIAKRADLPRRGDRTASEGYVTLQGLISHEYFHTWNVKRLRPAEFARYDYDHENYTELLWFFEGFTSYYDDVLLRRAERVDDAGYLKLLTKTVNQVLQTPGRAVQSVAEASFDAWTKYYRVDENTPNATVSYYTKGALVALCLDLSLRTHGTRLDAVMRELWRSSQGGPISEADIADALARVSGRSFARELRQWVHGTQDLPLRQLLGAHGVTVDEEPSQTAQWLGLRVTEGAGGLQIKNVLRGGACEAAGFAPGDEWLGVEGSDADTPGWRLQKLDDLKLCVGKARSVTALVSRDQRLLRLPLRLPAPATTWRLSVRDPASLAAWLCCAPAPRA